MQKYWIYTQKSHRIRLQTTITLAKQYSKDSDALFDILELISKDFDIPKPVILSKHNKEFNDFASTRFSKDDFIESILFDYLVIEILREKRSNSDPRNDFYM